MGYIGTTLKDWPMIWFYNEKISKPALDSLDGNATALALILADIKRAG